jgi:peptidoglycan/xylan/chitin deacetylase (PgdA/CDA1 family)
MSASAPGIDSLRSMAKSAIFAGLYHSGVCRALSARNNARGRRATIVTFHRVADRDPADPFSLPTLFISPERFGRVLEFLRSRYRIVALGEILSALPGGDALPPNALAITFDDGYRDVFDHAVPILRGASLPATVFLPTAYINTPGAVFWWDEAWFLLGAARERGGLLDALAAELDGSLPPEILRGVSTVGTGRWKAAVLSAIDRMQSCPPSEVRALLDALWERTAAERGPFLERNAIATWDEIRRASKYGIAFGSHTRNHVFLHREPEARVRDELRTSREEIEKRLGVEVRDFAYPGGRITPDVKRWVREAGYRCGLTTEPGVNGDGDEPFALRRIDMWNGSVTGHGETFSGAQVAVKLLGIG